MKGKYLMRTTHKIAAAAGALLLLAGCAPTPTAGTADSGGSTGTGSSGVVVDTVDITQLCGDEEIQVALTDGAGGHTWRKTVLAEFEAEAAKCDNITDVLYADAGNDPQKAAADIAGFVAQGVDVIVTLPDHGDALLPAMREAHDAGVVIIDYYNLLGGTPGSDFTAAVAVDSFAQGAEMGTWVGENAEPGNVIVLGGVASSPSATDIFEGAKEALAEYPDFTVLGDSFVVTEYNPETTERAVAGLLNKHGNITAVISEYGTISDAAMNAFAAAGVDYPALANSSGQNSVYCNYEKRAEEGSTAAFASWEKSTQVVRAALRRGLAELNGIDYTAEGDTVVFEKAVDTTEDLLPPACDPTLPEDADMFTGLTREQLEAAIG